MRTKLLLNNADASVNQTSDPVQLDQRVEWLLEMVKTGTDGNPKVYIEQGFNHGGMYNPAPPTDWFVIANKCLATGEFIIDDSPYSIESRNLKGNWFRMRLEPNGTTTGTLNALFAYKTFT